MWLDQLLADAANHKSKVLWGAESFASKDVFDFFFFILMYSFVLFGWVRSVADKSIEKQLWLTCFIIDFTFSKTKKKIETLFIKLLMWWFIWLNLIFQTHSFTYTRNKTLSSFCCPMREIEKWCKMLIMLSKYLLIVGHP